MLDKSKKSEIFSMFKDFQKEREMAISNGISSVRQKKVLLVDGL